MLVVSCTIIASFNRLSTGKSVDVPSTSRDQRRVRDVEQVGARHIQHPPHPAAQHHFAGRQGEAFDLGGRSEPHQAGLDWRVQRFGRKEIGALWLVEGVRIEG